MNELLNKDLERYQNTKSIPRFQKYLRKCQTSKNRITKLIYKVIYYKLARKNHIEISASTKISGGLYFGHPFCITINPAAIIGHNCNIHKGALDKTLVKKHKCIQKKCKHLEKYSEDAFRLNKYKNRSKK